MSKRFSTFYKAQSVRIQLQPDGGEKASTQMGRLFIGLKLSDEFMGQKEISRICGFLTEDEHLREIQKTAQRPTTLLFSQQSVAGKIGFIKELLLTLVPIDQKKQLNPYNSKYNLILIVNSDLSLNQVADQLYGTVFMLGPNRNFEYVVLDGSIREKRSRKTSSRFSSGGSILSSLDFPEENIQENPIGANKKEVNVESVSQLKLKPERDS